MDIRGMTEVRDWMGQGEHWEGGWRGLGLGEGHREVGAWVTVGIIDLERMGLKPI